MDPDERARITSRVSQSGDYARAMSTLRERGFRARYALEDAIPFHEEDTIAQERWIQVVLPFWRDGVEADQITPGDAAVLIALVDQERVAVLALDFPEGGERSLYASVDGQDVGNEPLVMARPSSGGLGGRVSGYHVFCVNFYFFSRCVNRCRVICVVFAGVSASSCGVVCAYFFRNPTSVGGCAAFCALVAFGSCDQACRAAYGHV